MTTIVMVKKAVKTEKLTKKPAKKLARKLEKSTKRPAEKPGVDRASAPDAEVHIGMAAAAAEAQPATSRLLKEKGGKLFLKTVRLEQEPGKLRAVLDPTRWRILGLLAEHSTYPAELAKRLGLHEQKVYYHIKQLENAGLIKIINKQEFGGALAKFYVPTEFAFALELPFGDERLATFPMKTENPKLKRFLFPLVANGKLNAEIVVGSPDPHGPHQVRARDGHLAADVALFLGQFCALPQNTATRIDADVKAEKTIGKNMILIGGILTNVITADVNHHMPVRFQTERFPFRGIVSERTGKIYEEEDIGVVVKAVNPFNKEKSILVLAGNSYNGTVAAILALTRKTEDTLASYKNEDRWARIVQGIDMDGDGRVDEIKILE